MIIIRKKLFLPLIIAGKIAQALFEITLYPETVDLDTLYSNFTELLNQPEILVMKKTKKKGLKEIDIKPHILKVNVTKEADCVKCNMLLPAGSTTNINPTLFINAYNEKYSDDVIYRITRLDVFNDKGESFK